MKLSRLHKMVAGVLIMFTGIGLLLDGLGIISFRLFDLLPLLLVYFGIRLWNQEKRIRGGILLFLGMVILLETWFSIGPFDLFEWVIPLLLIYFGFRLIRGRNWEKEDSLLPREDSTARQERNAPISHDAPAAAQVGWQGWGRRRMRDRLHAEAEANGNAGTLAGGILRRKDTRSLLIGDFHLTSGRFELDHLQIWHGIGNVVIDLSRAILLREEAVLSVEGWIGDVTVYVPVDLPVSVTAEVSVGDLEVFGHRQGGISRSIIIRSENFDPDAQHVLLQISLLIGDVKVKYI